MVMFPPSVPATKGRLESRRRVIKGHIGSVDSLICSLLSMHRLVHGLQRFYYLIIMLLFNYYVILTKYLTELLKGGKVYLGF